MMEPRVKQTNFRMVDRRRLLGSFILAWNHL